MNKYLCLSLILLFFCSHGLIAQVDDTPIIQSDTIRIVKKTQVIGLPLIFYTPETSFGFGGGAQFLFSGLRNIFNSRLSDMVVTAVYTTKNQLMIEAKPQIQLYNGQFYLEGFLRYKIFPNSFWGIGNQTAEGDLEAYNMKSTEISAVLLKRIPPFLNFGFEYMFQHHYMLEKDENGILAQDTIPGSQGALVSAFSAVFSYDDRDNVFSAVSGSYYQLKAGFNSRVMGSNFSYNKYRFDLRKYFLLTNKVSLATQYYMEMSFGEVPFQVKPWLGGPERTRGYFKGRYIDDQFYAMQAELRWRFKKRWILSGFISGGEVANLIVHLYDDFKFSYGGGVRFQLARKSPTLMRFDVGFDRLGNYGFYFGVNEAF